MRFGETTLPNWVSAICAVLLLTGLGTGVNAVTSSGSRKTHTKPQPPPPASPVLLDSAGPTGTKPGSNTNLASGLAVISGAPFPHSVRQLYSANCCGDNQSATYAIPEGYTRFQASIGLETGNGYDASGSLAITFEVDLGGRDNRAYVQQMTYGEPARRVNLDVSGQSAIVLQTQTDATNCFTCSADAAWGDAKLIP